MLKWSAGARAIWPVSRVPGVRASWSSGRCFGPVPKCSAVLFDQPSVLFVRSFWRATFFQVSNRDFWSWSLLVQVSCSHRTIERISVKRIGWQHSLNIFVRSNCRFFNRNSKREREREREKGGKELKFDVEDPLEFLFSYRVRSGVSVVELVRVNRITGRVPETRSLPGDWFQWP